MNIYDETVSLLFPHRRAERLIDEEIDAARGDGALSTRNAAWLDQHVMSCAECRAVRAQRRVLLDALRGAAPIEAPTGFAGRVLMAAKARGRNEIEVPTYEPEPNFAGRRLAIGGFAAVAMAVALFVFAGEPHVGQPNTSGLHVSGHGTEGLSAPHFTVRAPGIGAAQVRAQISQIVADHEGRLVTSGDEIRVEIPRERLIAVVQDLARRGRFKVTKADAGEVGPDVETIVLRFELD